VRAALYAFAACAAFAQPADAKSFFAITTRDAAPLVAWYTSNFDLTVAHTGKLGEDATLVLLDGPLATIEIIARRDLPTLPGQPWERTGIFKAGLFVDDLDPWLARWRAAGVTIDAGPFDTDKPPLRSVVLLDPDGNNIHVSAPKRRD
jgi:catechol 2,3-dioxygenase-like lactoylglutathione lyase family enzyme